MNLKLMFVEHCLQSTHLEAPKYTIEKNRLSSHVQSLSHVRLFTTPWSVACQAPLFMGFFRQRYWNGCLLLGLVPTQGSNLCLLNWQVNTFFFFSFIFISWRLITLQYCSGFSHTLTLISHGVTVWEAHIRFYLSLKVQSSQEEY